MAPVWTTSDEKILFPMHSWPWRHTMTGAPRNMWSGMRSLSNLNLINWLRWSSLSKNDVTQSTDTVSRSPWNAENKKSTQGHEKWVWGSKWSKNKWSLFFKNDQPICVYPHLCASALAVVTSGICFSSPGTSGAKTLVWENLPETNGFLTPK